MLRVSNSKPHLKLKQEINALETTDDASYVSDMWQLFRRLVCLCPIEVVDDGR